LAGLCFSGLFISQEERMDADSGRIASLAGSQAVFDKISDSQIPQAIGRTILEQLSAANEVCFYMHGSDQNKKSDHYPLLIPNIPNFQHSIIPWVII
jgi:hypothetical protein